MINLSHGSSYSQDDQERVYCNQCRLVSMPNDGQISMADGFLQVLAIGPSLSLGIRALPPWLSTLDESEELGDVRMVLLLEAIGQDCWSAISS